MQRVTSLSVKRCKELGVGAASLRHNLRFIDWHKAQSNSWYMDAYEWCVDMAEYSGRDFEEVAAVLALTSQQTSWSDNLAITEAYCMGWEPRHAFPAVHYKVERILAGEPPEAFVSGDKIIPFWLAIRTGGLDTCCPVIDRWVPRYFMPDWEYKEYLDGDVTISPAAHRYLQGELSEVADELGLNVHDLHAHIWENIREWVEEVETRKQRR